MKVLLSSETPRPPDSSGQGGKRREDKEICLGQGLSQDKVHYFFYLKFTVF